MMHCDFSGPHTEDIDGHTQVYVGVEASTCYGYAGLQKGRTAAETLESVKAFESELKQHSNEPNRRVAGFHHDDDKSFRGSLEKYAQDSGWKDTHTGGYRPQANSIAESRIGMLNQLFRCMIPCIDMICCCCCSSQYQSITIYSIRL